MVVDEFGEIGGDIRPAAYFPIVRCSEASQRSDPGPAPAISGKVA